MQPSFLVWGCGAGWCWRALKFGGGGGRVGVVYGPGWGAWGYNPWGPWGYGSGYGYGYPGFGVAPNTGEIKLDTPVITPAQLAKLTECSNYVAEIANMTAPNNQPYVGVSAFAHKGGLHVAAMMKRADSYQHIDPALVGNEKRVLVSELSGQRNITAKLAEQGIDIALSPAEARAILEQVKAQEAKGYQYEGAEASFELLVRRSQPGYRAPFELEDFLIIERRRWAPDADKNDIIAEAVVHVKVGDQKLQTAGEGNGPVNALDGAVRKALLEFYPQLSVIKLVDYKVRILEGVKGTGAVTRTLVGSSDGQRRWDTVGVHENVIAASWMALEDAVAYGLLRASR